MALSQSLSRVTICGLRDQPHCTGLPSVSGTPSHSLLPQRDSATPCQSLSRVTISGLSEMSASLHKSVFSLCNTISQSLYGNNLFAPESSTTPYQSLSRVTISGLSEMLARLHKSVFSLCYAIPQSLYGNNLQSLLHHLTVSMVTIFSLCNVISGSLYGNNLFAPDWPERLCNSLPEPL